MFLEMETTMERSPSPDRETYTKAVAAIDELIPEMASFFIEKFMSATNGDEVLISLQLACGCGGPEVSDLIKLSLSDQGLPELKRNTGSLSNIRRSSSSGATYSFSL
jgi:hypothetical protein